MKFASVVRFSYLLFAFAALVMLASTSASAQTYRFVDLLDFNGSNGANPYATPTVSGGMIYGTTYNGGLNNDGTVYCVDIAKSTWTQIATFNGANGANPYGGVVLSKDGATLYGTTKYGGANGNGTVFSVPATGGVITTLYSFEAMVGLANVYGAWPQSTPILSADGSTLYGTTVNGGVDGYGAVFSIPAAGGAPSCLAHCSISNGANPEAGVTLSKDGSMLYGAASGGGGNESGCVYKVPVTGGGPILLASFGYGQGSQPCSILTLSADGSTLYGVASGGGASGNGVAFAIPSSGGAITVLHSFAGGSDSASPIAGLTLSADGGTLFGTSQLSGSASKDPNNDALVYSLPVTGGAITHVSQFCESTPTDNENIYAGLALSGTSFYGATVGGGAYGAGMVYELILLANTTTKVEASPNPSTFGAAVTMTATVSPKVPDGETVTFLDGTNVIGTGTTSGSVASLATSTLTAASHGITASYAGDATFAPSTSSFITQTVVTCHPTTALSTSLSPTTYGQAITFTASMSPALPDGETVNFYDGATSKALIGTGLTFGGMASFTTSALIAGTHTIWADYVGDSNYAYSWSSSLTQTVNKAASSVTVTSSLNPSTFGAPVTITATLSPSVPNGETITFFDGGPSIGTGKVSGGKATLTVSSLVVGSQSIWAYYGGDGNYNASTSNTLSQVVNQTPTTTTLTSSLNPSTYGPSLTFVATISPSVPNGETLTFLDGSTSIGTATTFGGKATFSISSLAVGSHSITASYPGDASYVSSTSGVLTQTVVVSHPTTSLVSSLNPSTYGQTVTFTATVTPSVPDGETVNFYDGATSKTLIGTGTTTGSVAKFATSALGAGSHTIWADYVGDANHAYSWSSSLAQVVNKPLGTLSLTSSPTSSNYGATVTFTATLGSTVPSGESVTFLDGSTSIGTGKTSAGKATFATTALAVGSHSITASYPGDANNLSVTSNVLTQSVAVCHPTTALASTVNPSIYLQSVTFTATISTSVPNGETVNFYDGATSKALIGTGTTSGGVATFTTSALAAGSHTIWADYVGDSNCAYSWSSSLAQTVNKAAATVSLTSSLNPSTYMASVTFTATTGSTVPNGETVTFFDGSTSLGTGKISGGKATLATTALAMGSRGITASYPGDSNNQPVTSSVLTQVVSQAATTTKLASSLNASTYGGLVTFTATISPSVPNGETVTFYDGSTSIGSGVTSGGKATFSTPSLAVGNHSITASYPGDTSFLASTSATLTQTVVICHPATVLTSSLNPATAGALVTFTATVSLNVPDGETVSFYDGATSKVLLGAGTTTSGVATLATSKLARGSHTIWAQYAGDANHTYSWSTSLAQTVN